jgi:ribosomal-protein-alanine N-acetyltransferase
MCREDVPQVNEIDQLAFSTIWTPFNYEHELSNPLARYVVACSSDETYRMIDSAKTANRLAARFKRLFNSNIPLPDERETIKVSPYIVGFTGFWVLAGEAHITNIAVRQEYQRQGIGESLIITVMDLASELNAEFVTLEVRVSNTVAQNLYRKYGFAEVGLRHRYYHDNGEDALLMSTENLDSPPFIESIQKLKQSHGEKWAIPFRDTSE